MAVVTINVNRRERDELMQALEDMAGRLHRNKVYGRAGTAAALAAKFRLAFDEAKRRPR